MKPDSAKSADLALNVFFVFYAVALLLSALLMSGAGEDRIHPWWVGVMTFGAPFTMFGDSPAILIPVMWCGFGYLAARMRGFAVGLLAVHYAGVLWLTFNGGPEGQGLAAWRTMINSGGPFVGTMLMLYLGGQAAAVAAVRRSRT